MKILYITTSRSDFGIAINLLKRLKDDHYFNLSIFAGGSHFSKKFGNTQSEIIKNNFKIKHKLKIKNFEKQKKEKISQLHIDKIHKIISINNYKLVIILGDRFEMLSCAFACYMNQQKILHIHGGEKTLGSQDNEYRNLISMMSHTHFVSHKNYLKNLNDMGINKNIYDIGSLSLAGSNSIKENSIEKILKNLGVSNSIIIVSYHPNSINENHSTRELKIIISAISQLNDINFIFTAPNFDNNFLKLTSMIKEISNRKKNIYFIESLGHDNFISLLKKSIMIIGNSSSGMIEAPYVKTPTLNIGDRQKGRVHHKSIFNCNFNKKEIFNKIKLITDMISRKKIKFDSLKAANINNCIKIIKSLDN